MHLRQPVLGQWISALLLSSSVALAQTPQPDPGPEQPDPTTSAEPTVPVDKSWRRPLASRNQFPVSLMFVSMTPDSATSLSRNHTNLDIRFDYSNMIAEQESGEEFLFLDLEYLRTDVAVEHGLSKNMEIGISIPFYFYYGGFLDGFVDGLHETFGLPNYLRGQTDHGLTRYEFVTGPDAPFLGGESIRSVGDITVHLKRTLFEDDVFAFAARSDIKFPTGDPEKLSGSGAADLGLGIAFDRITERWGVYTNANYHFLGQPDAFRVKNFFSLMLGLDYRIGSRTTAHLQYDFAQPFVDSGLFLFNSAAQQVALGLRWRYSDRFVYEWRFVEDISKVSPDFTLGFQVSVRWSGTSPNEESTSP